MATIKGGDKLGLKLGELGKKVASAKVLRVGFLEGSTYPNGTTVATVAAIQEYGAPRAHIPPRPFFRNMVAAKKGKWPKAIRDLLKANGYDALRTLQQIGEAIAGQLRQSIIDTNSPPLSPVTIARKGFDKPLVDTGHMLNSINYEVKA